MIKKNAKPIMQQVRLPSQVAINMEDGLQIRGS